MKRFIKCILCGLLLALSWPTYGFPFLLFVAFVPLLLLEHEITLKKEKHTYLKIFLFSYISFLIWNYGATQWLHYAKNPDGSNSWVAFLIPLFSNSLLMSITFLLFHFVKKVAGTWYGMFFFPVIWIGFEKFHLSWEMSWPWLNLGNAFANFPQAIQWYEYTGTFGGTLWVLIVNLIIFYYIRAYQVTHQKVYLWRPLFYSILLIGVPLAISFLIYQSYKEKSEDRTEVILVQPDLDPYEEKYELNGEVILNDILNLADKQITTNTRFVIAPETAFPGRGSILINEFKDDPYINRIKIWLNKHPQINFISGVSLAEYYNQQQTTSSRYVEKYNQWIDFYNSAIQINQEPEIQHYNKSKLVVGVELFPYANYLKPILGNYMLNFGGSMESLGTQDQPEIFINHGLKIAPIICYESIYGEYVSEFVKNGANAIFVMTNDSWWGDSEGHRQLLSYARLRAIETRRDIARSANSGISAFINQRGDIVKDLAYLKKGSLKGDVNFNSELTFYVKYGDLISRISYLIAGILLAYTVAKLFLEKINLKRRGKIK
ncbi:apolipoprotein N-acyltransferase [Apibacter muscae]|uniref:apolipoprotein N-acyltransferase n=1 Tax=Apibacter muscae TaxID=2509004 RepID=UPI0011AD12B6|nr:apolipoprotein N-acyltransferase [Apibacter muscae]TWP30203.1 apolipoprotein N-acyltransferase [Apibacter muscae]